MGKMMLILCLLAGSATAYCQNYKFQALYVFNIAQNIEWPGVINHFTIGVVGSHDMAGELTQIFKTRKLGGLPVVVKPIEMTIADITNCQLVYLGRGASSKLEALVPYVRTKPVLVVSDKTGLSGAGINMLDNASKLEFEILPSIIKEQGLKVAGSLLNLAIVK